MKLPNAHRAIIEKEKILDYLLNLAHPDNGGKAAYYLGLGFSREGWQVNSSGLREWFSFDPTPALPTSGEGVIASKAKQSQ